MDLPELRRRPDLLAAGFSDHEVQRFVRVGELARVRRGAYVRGAVPEDALARHVLAVRAAAGQLADGAVVSHASAAVLHGLPVRALRFEKVHVTRARRSGGRAGTRVHVHTAALALDEVVAIEGLPATSLVRTVVDLARTLPFEEAVGVADAAMFVRRVDRVERVELLDGVERARRWPGVPAARRVITFADGLAESVGESRSRIAIAAAGLPVPVLQWEVRRAGSGAFVGRVDFGWPELRTVGEFDGLVKYGYVGGRDPVEVLVAEKRREDAIRAEGLAVVRWTWDELRNFDAVAARIGRAFR